MFMWPFSQLSDTVETVKVMHRKGYAGEENKHYYFPPPPSPPPPSLDEIQEEVKEGGGGGGGRKSTTAVVHHLVCYPMNQRSLCRKITVFICPQMQL